MANDPWEPFRTLYKALQDSLDPLYVEILGWALLPDVEDGSCQVSFRVKKEAFLDNEERATRKAFDEMIAGQRVVEHQQKIETDADEARSKLINITKDGIFGDVDDSP